MFVQLIGGGQPGVAAPATAKPVTGSGVPPAPAEESSPGDHISRAYRGLAANLLARVRGAGEPKYVDIGTLRVPKDEYRDFQAAEKYLSKDPEAPRILYGLEHAKGTYTLRLIHDGNDRFDPSNDTISWDPRSALRTTNGAAQTPALGLLHEEDHAYEHDANPSRQTVLEGTFDAHYDTLEEKRVIAGVETRAANILGEGVRHDHGGTAFVVSSPIAR